MLLQRVLRRLGASEIAAFVGTTAFALSRLHFPALLAATSIGELLALTFVLGPVFFGAFGWVIDRILGTQPVFMIAFGVLGVIAGFGLGLLALRYRNEFLDLMNRVTGFELFPRNIYAFDRLPALIVPGDIAIICGGSLFICLLAGLLPAWNAGRLQPVEALRNE